MVKGIRNSNGEKGWQRVSLPDLQGMRDNRFQLHTLVISLKACEACRCDN
jgi:hypothetical protein